LHEGFHASWHKNKMPEFSERWFVKLPVVSEARVLGRIEAFGHHQDANTFVVMSALAEMLEELQPSIHSLVHDFQETQQPAKSSRESRVASDAETVVDAPLRLELENVHATKARLN
jgi:UDP-GlcNAc:undecaprenyl-phosphate GlcNAc-1-phosphate transferase